MNLDNYQEEDKQRCLDLLHGGCDLTVLRDSYAHFSTYRKVRVREGAFKGLEGREVRIRRDRKIVIPIGPLAVAVDGIDRSLFETVE